MRFNKSERQILHAAGYCEYGGYVRDDLPLGATMCYIVKTRGLFTLYIEHPDIGRVSIVRDNLQRLIDDMPALAVKLAKLLDVFRINQRPINKLLRLIKLLGN